MVSFFIYLRFYLLFLSGGGGVQIKKLAYVLEGGRVFKNEQERTGGGGGGVKNRQI